jgi:hypothetical protein
MQQGERVKHVEWGIGMEFGLECRVQLLQSGQSVPMSRSSNSASPLASQPLAHRERPVPSPLNKKNQPEPPTMMVDEVSRASSGLPEVNQVEQAHQVSPVAKKSIVRENTTVASPSPSLEVLKEKATHDPVVQEVMRTFTAKIVDIRPK